MICLKCLQATKMIGELVRKSLVKTAFELANKSEYFFDLNHRLSFDGQKIVNADLIVWALREK